MSVNQTPFDPIPEEFDSYDEVADFWDAHDTTDYPEAFKTVQVAEVDIRNRRFEVEVESVPNQPPFDYAQGSRSANPGG
jgi:hypothetical protein